MASDTTTKISTLKQMVARFVEERHWERYENPKDLALSISIEAGELLEVFQWMSASSVARITPKSVRGKSMKLELADVLIYCLLMAHVLKLDVASLITEKIKRNAEKYPAADLRWKHRKTRGKLNKTRLGKPGSLTK